MTGRETVAGKIRRCVTGQTIYSRWDLEQHRTVHYVKPGALVHLTDGTAGSRTGRNLRSLCGKLVRPDADTPGNIDEGRLCAKCNRARDDLIDAAVSRGRMSS